MPDRFGGIIPWKGTIMTTIDTFVNVAAERADAFEKAAKAVDKGNASMAVIWTEIILAIPEGIEAKVAYKRLPETYTARVSEGSFAVYVTNVRAVHRVKAAETVAFVKASGSINKAKAAVQPKAAAPKKDVTHVVTAEASAEQMKVVFSQVTSVIKRLNDDQLAALIAEAQAEQARRKA